MAIAVRIRQNEIMEEILMNDVQLTSGASLACTAFEYGSILANVIERYLKVCADTDVDVCTEEGTTIHRLKIMYVKGECLVTDRVDGTYKPTVSFMERSEKIPDRYLILVDASRNKNEFYKMSDLGGGEWSATYGRIGEKQGRSRMTRNVVVPKSYPDYMFGIKLLEKLLIGYQDKSVCHGLTVFRRKNPDAAVFGIKNQQVAVLVEKLMAYAQNIIRQNYTVSFTDVTQEMIAQAKAEIDHMRGSRSLEEFNQHLLALMHIIPRKIDGKGDAGVKRMLAVDKNGFAEILMRETELLDIMEGQIVINGSTPQQDGNILEKLGLTIEEASPEQVDEVKRHLNDSLKSKLKQVFSVTNQNTQRQFKNYLDNSADKDKNRSDTRLFWHGSRNANWFSILQKGLMLNPDALITGKMFGNGIYFAPSAIKSWGYTSSREAKWNNEASNEAYMALYETAYGKPYEVYTFTENWDGYSYCRLQTEHPGYTCVHAKKSQGMLYNDEVIFYREDQVTIRYICLFQAE